MAESIEIELNGSSLKVEAGTSVAAALMAHGLGCRTSVQGEKRGPLCGMGVCFECRAVIDGVAHRRSCMVLCRAGMEIHSL